ncbi:response regulator [Azospirillum isscasi]|uniref:response regulator n=1 Tax=Azospirillum isscasi TaxID=3053926 RepID=UPI0027D242A0|nr:response regulator [Azospirillum isscasi]
MFLLFLLLLAAPALATVLPQAERGVLDLRGWYADLDGPVSLDGEWLVSWDRLAGEESLNPLPEPDGRAWVPFALPAIWNGAERPDGQAMGGMGAATFRLKILLPPGMPPLTLKMPPVNSAMRVWVDGRPVAAAGVPALTAAQEQPGAVSRFVTLHGGQRVVELAVEVSNHFHFEGGIGRTIFLDANGGLARLWQRQLMTNAGALMSLSLMALFIAAFLRRRLSAAPLFLVMLLAACAMRLICTSELLRVFFPGVSEVWAYRLEYLPIYMFYPIYYHLLRELFPGCLHQGVGRAMMAVAVPGMFLVLVTEPAQFTRLRDVASLLLVLSAIYFAWRLAVAALRRHAGALLLGAGALAFLGSVVHDALMYAHFFESIDLVPYGALMFLFSHALVLGRRVETAFLNERRLSQELAALNEGLERQIAERTRALSDKSATLERFLANLSHEVRTPLNAVLGMVRVIRREGPTDRLDERLRVADGAGRHLVSMLDTILDLSRLEAGRMELHPQPTDVVALVEDAVALMRAGAEEKGLALSLTVSGMGAARFWIDPLRLRQIVLNLLSNAVKFTERGGVDVTLTAEPAPPGLGSGTVTLCLIVADSGPGVPRAAQAVIFEPFHRLEGHRLEGSRRDGAGLGLAIVNGLVGLMGGEVGLSGRAGGGSVFTVSLPTRPLPVADPSPGRAAPMPVPGSLDILVVEDAPENQAILHEYLAPGGHRAVYVDSGEEALAVLAGRGVDVVLLDMRLPGIDGVEVTRRIRALPDAERALVPVIAVTANSSAEDRAAYLEAGVDEVVAKPVDPDALQDALARHAPSGSFPSGFSQPGSLPFAPPDAPPDSLRRTPVPAVLTGADRARLMERFAQACREVLAVLEAAETTPRRIADAAHRMKGSGATYGFPEVSMAARALEKSALAVEDGSGGPASMQGDAAALRDRLRAALRAIEKGEAGLR